MLSKIKALSEKKVFAIGMTLVLVGSALCAFPFNLLTRIIGSIVVGFGFLFVIIASDKKHSKTNKKDK
jgi:hypothetical protein